MLPSALRVKEFSGFVGCVRWQLQGLFQHLGFVMTRQCADGDPFVSKANLKLVTDTALCCVCNPSESLLAV